MRLGEPALPFLINGCVGAPTATRGIERQPPPERLSQPQWLALNEILADIRDRSRRSLAAGNEALIPRPPMRVPARA